jgi:2-amino-4-hydroxy-6-hydroxymethyldihydropteridine diphosphokinase
MTEFHRAWLSVGSNIEPESNLPEAIRLLGEYGQVQAVSSAWESQAVGSSGPNYLNACALFLTSLSAQALKQEVIRPIEARLGRVRGDDKNAPRTIDIDTMMYDDTPMRLKRWDYAFVLVPLAELAPELPHPATGETVGKAAERVGGGTWIVPRRDVISATKS